MCTKRIIISMMLSNNKLDTAVSNVLALRLIVFNRHFNTRPSILPFQNVRIIIISSKIEYRVVKEVKRKNAYVATSADSSGCEVPARSIMGPLVPGTREVIVGQNRFNRRCLSSGALRVQRVRKHRPQAALTFTLISASFRPAIHHSKK